MKSPLASVFARVVVRCCVMIKVVDEREREGRLEQIRVDCLVILG